MRVGLIQSVESLKRKTEVPEEEMILPSDSSCNIASPLCLQWAMQISGLPAFTITWAIPLNQSLAPYTYTQILWILFFSTTLTYCPSVWLLQYFKKLKYYPYLDKLYAGFFLTPGIWPLLSRTFVKKLVNFFSTPLRYKSWKSCLPVLHPISLNVNIKEDSMPTLPGFCEKVRA